MPAQPRSSIFANPHLRVTVPETTDGINLKYRNDKVVTKVFYLPMSAKKYITSASAKLPAHLRFTIEEVQGDNAPVVKKKAATKKPE